MLLSIENAHKTLSNGWLIVGGLNAMAIAVFLAPLSRDLPTPYFLALLAIAACVGLAIGIYLTFRSDCGTASAFFRLFYILLTLEFLFAGGSAAGALWIAGRHDLCWLAFYINSFSMAISLLGGMCREANTLGLWRRDMCDRWKAELEKYIDYSKYQVSPALTGSYSAADEKWIKSAPWIVAVGSANIPLLFEIFGGGRSNAIFVAAPLMTGVLAYINLTNCGPGLVRLLLLRKLEKTIGRRFVNTDLEQIQELRRTFFLSRWLMKDYAPPNPALTAQKREARQRKRK